MGAYLSEPIVDKISCDEKSDKAKLSFGASSMQGWRVSQEDAHNCILDFDTDTSLFAVYDGHGGSEVAAYCAEHLPDFLKSIESYKQGDMAKALEEAYLEFDHHLTKDQVVKALHVLAGNKNKGAASDEDPDEMSDLYEEATMSIEELIARYGKQVRDGVDEKGEGISKASALEKMMAKVCASKGKLKCKSTSNKSKPDAKSEPINSEGAVETKSEEEEEEAKPVANEDEKEKANSPVKTETEKESNEVSNGKSNDHNNGSTENEDHSIKASVGKGKGVGKGLSNSIRKVVQLTPEEQERERREAERLAKRMERKKSLRTKSADELYRSIVSTTEKEEEDDSSDDDEEDEDFDGETSDSSDDAPEAAGEEEDDDEWEDQEDEEDEEEEEDSAEVAKTARNFSMNLKEEPGSDSGCTAVVALLHGNTLYVANAGDSRCVLSRQGRAIPLSADHKPEDEPEKSRIERAGGVVTADGRVNGGLNLSRAIGDHAYKQNKELGPREQMITALPDIQTIDLQPGDDFIVLACDGIWNSKSNQQVVDFVRPLLIKGEPLSKICEKLFDDCMAPNTMGDGTGCDNMTGIIVRLDRFLPEALNQKSETTSPSGPVKRPLPDDSSTDEAQIDSNGGEKNKRQRVDEEEEVKEPSS